MRAHLNYPIVNTEGTLQSETPPVVRVMNTGTFDLISETLYQSNSGVNYWDNPLIATGGIVDFYLPDEKRVQLGVRIGSQDEVFYEVDVLMPHPDVAPDSIRIKAPDDTVWTITVDNDGVLHTDNGL